MRKLVLITCIVLAVLTAKAQQNVIKVGIPNMLYGEYHIGYERLINDKQSINFKAGFFQPVSSFFINKESLALSKEFTVKGVDGGYQTSFEYRFYMSNPGSPSGFYIAPYARLAQLFAKYTDEVQGMEFNVAGTGTVTGLGAQLGYHWLIYEVLSIDFHFFGAGLDYWSPKLVYTRDGFTNYASIEPDIKDAVKVDDDIKKYFNPEKKITTKVNSDNLTARMPLFMPGFRVGLTLGYAF